MNAQHSVTEHNVGDKDEDIHARLEREISGLSPEERDQYIDQHFWNPEPSEPKLTTRELEEPFLEMLKMFEGTYHEPSSLA